MCANWPTGGFSSAPPSFHEYEDDCTSGFGNATVVPVVLTPDGGLDAVLHGSAVHKHSVWGTNFDLRDVIELPSGGLVASGSVAGSLCSDPVYFDYGTVDAFDGSGGPLHGGDIRPRVDPP